MKLVAFPILLTISLLGAGCLSVPDVDPDLPGEDPVAFAKDWYVNAVPSSITHPEHKHAVRSEHAGLTTPNFGVIGWDPLETDTFGTTLNGMGCGGAVTREDGRRLAVVHSIETAVSFVVADVTDPEHPRMQGEYYYPNGQVWDADISADGKHVLIGANPPDTRRGIKLPVPAVDAPAWATGHDGMFLFRDACSGEVSEVGPDSYLPGPSLVLVNIEDPENPKFETYVTQPLLGPHSVGSQMIDGVVYAHTSITNLVQQVSYYNVYEIKPNPTGSLMLRWAFQTPGLFPPGLLNGHTDLFLQKHPVTGKLLAHLANWDAYYVYDLSTPVPMQIGKWADGNAGNVHTTFPFPEVRDGKQYIVVGQEVGAPSDDSKMSSGWVYLLDMTDPTKPTEVGRWTLPVDPKWDNKFNFLIFSPHYVAILEDIMFVTNYHGGMWAVDISDMTKPEAVGIFVPDREAPKAYGAKTYGPSLEDVILDPTNNVLTVWDNAGGIYQLTYDLEMDAPRAPAWELK